MKKFIAMLLALTMALSMVGTAWAEGDGSIAVEYDANATAKENGTVLWNTVMNAPDGATINVPAGTYLLTDGQTSRFNGKSFTLIGEEGTVIQGEKYGLVLQDSTDPNSDVEITLKNLRIESGKVTTWGHPVYVKYNITVNLYDLELVNNTGTTAILLDNCNYYDDGKWYTRDDKSGTVVNAYNVTIEDGDTVEFNGNPCNAYPTEDLTYTYFNFDEECNFDITDCKPQNVSRGYENHFVNGVCINPYVAKIGDVSYGTLADAYAALSRSNPSTPEVITLLSNCSGGGIGSDGDTGMNYVIDFNGYTYTVGEPPVGSTSTQTQGFRVMKGSTAVFKDGTLLADDVENLKQIVHTYGDVTFDNFTVDAREDSYATIAVEADCGKLNITGNSNIFAREGTIGLYAAFWHYGNYDGTTVNVNTTGTITGKLVYEFDERKTGNEAATANKGYLNIANGNFDISEIKVMFSGTIAEELQVANISITGGTFSADPKAYVAAGYKAVEGGGKYTVMKTYSVTFDANGGENEYKIDPVVEGKFVLPENPFTAPTDKQFKAWNVDGKEYAVGAEITVAADVTVTAVWMNAPAAVLDTEVMIQVAPPEVTVSDEVAADAEKAAIAAQVEVSDICTDAMTGVVEELAEEEVVVTDAQVSALEDVLEEDVDEDDVVVVIQTNFEVEIADIVVENNAPVITLNITPVYQKILTTETVASGNEKVEVGKNAVAIPDASGEMDLKGEEVPITIAIPEELAVSDGANGYKPLYVTHVKDNGTKYVYEAEVKQVGAGYTATFVNPNGFSSFSVSTVNNTTVTMNGMNYVDLQSAVNDLGKDAVITVLAGDQQAEVAGNASFTVVLENGATATITAADGYRVRENNGKYTVSKIYYGGYYTGTTTTETEKELVTSPDTFDAGIAVSVAVSVLGATGSAWLLRKKED